MNTVMGKVLLHETGVGIPNLVVTVYDVDSNTLPKGAMQSQQTSLISVWEQLQGKRLGSILNDPDGTFVLEYEDKERQEERPDLLLFVTAPEGPGLDGWAPVLHVSGGIRQNAGRIESYLVRLTADQLTKAGIDVPSVLTQETAPAQSRVQRLKDARLRTGEILDETLEVATRMAGSAEAVGTAADLERERQQKVREQIIAVRRKAVADARQSEEQMEKDLRDRVLHALTGVTPAMPQWKRFVAPGDDAQARSRETQKEAIATVINAQTQAVGTKTYLALTPEERQEIGDPPDPEVVERILRRRTSTPTLLREDPMALACLHRRSEHPFDPQTPPSPPTDPEEQPGPAIDVDGKVAQLVDGMQDLSLLANGGLPGPDTVSRHIKTLTLSKGPADAPAFYDFHNLQIAFDHVWEDARAEGVIEKAKAMYRAASESGGDPQRALSTHADPLLALSREMRVIYEAQGRYVEADVTAAAGSWKSAGTTMMARRRRNEDGSEPYPEPLEPSEPRPPRPPIKVFPGQVYDSSQVDDSSTPAKQGYPFTVFAAKSINFGILLTYRQKWEPVNYQVGRLVSTLTLAPKESISITTRQVVKTSFNQKQVQANQQMRKEEQRDTQRDEAEIVSRAQTKSNFALTTAGGFDLGPLGEGTYTTSFGRESDVNSQETKRAFHELTSQAAQEYRDERRLEVETGTSMETETTQKRELSNPNDELALTYVFYELQRRYRVSERLHRAVPVVMVGQQVPAPEEITENWILRHDWIIRRFLPDDSFRAALTYLATRATGDQIVLNELKNHMTAIRQVVDQLKTEVLSTRAEAASQYASLQGFVERRAAIERNEDSEGMFESAWEWAAGGDEESRDAIRILEEAARERYEKAAREEKDLRSRLERETTALQVATDSYTKAYAEYSNQRVQINRLIWQIQGNILHYVQGIWSYEQPDQQFFRHHTLMAPRLEALDRSYTLTELAEWPTGVRPQPGKQVYEVTFTTTIDENVNEMEKNATLAELADLKPVGCIGNYLLFPLKKSNALTDYMLTPYLDAELGLRDPDGLGNWTLQDFSAYVQCLRESLSAEEFASVEESLRRQYQELLADPLRDGEEIIVPTKSLYMQMIVDTGKALEEFKAAHRLLDVLKVKEEVRSTMIDNLRRAKMVLDGRLDDPNVESVKNVFYHGTVPPHDGDE